MTRISFEEMKATIKSAFVNAGMINSYLLKYYDKETVTNTIPYSTNIYQILLC